MRRQTVIRLMSFDQKFTETFNFGAETMWRISPPSMKLLGDENPPSGWRMFVES